MPCLTAEFCLTDVESRFQAIGEFVLTERNMRVPEKGKIYSINEGYTYLWDDAIKEYVRQKKDPSVSNHPPFPTRFCLKNIFLLLQCSFTVWKTVWCSLCWIDGC